MPLYVLGLDYEAENSLLACGYQIEHLAMIVASDAHEQGQRSRSRPGLMRPG